MRANELRIFSRAFVIVISHSGTVKSIELQSISLRCEYRTITAVAENTRSTYFVNEMSFIPWMNG